MDTRSGSQIIAEWPEQAREAAQLVIDRYGEPHEATESILIWNRVGPWKRMEATREFHKHNFPVPHHDSVTSVIEYRVPTDSLTPLAEFDGSVTVHRTTGEVSARCHDEEANRLALNLMHDLVTGEKDIQAARGYYGQEFLDFRRKKPTPYMDELRFSPHPEATAADPDESILTDEDLARASEEGQAS